MSRYLAHGEFFEDRREMALAKKQVPLRLNEKLYDALAAWAEADFRSVNGQIEYLLTECVKKHRKNGGLTPDYFDTERPNEAIPEDL